MYTRYILAAALAGGALGAPFAQAADLPPYGYGEQSEYIAPPPPPTVIERRVVEAPPVIERRVVIERRIAAPPPILERRVVVEHDVPPPIVERRVIVEHPLPPAPIPRVYDRTVVVDRPGLPVGNYIDDEDED